MFQKGVKKGSENQSVKATLNAISPSDAFYSSERRMDSVKANQLTSEFESKLSALLPDIDGLIDQYQVSGVVKAKIGEVSSKGCRYINGVPSCTSVPPELYVSFSPESLRFGVTSDPEVVQQFWTDIASKLYEPVIFLDQSIEQTGEMFEVRFYIDSSTINREQPVVCQWISDDILKCSNA